jgi:hypothetical protein
MATLGRQIMKPIELIETRLAEALQALDDAAGFVREAEEVDTDSNLRNLGKAIVYAWEVREAVHKIRPDLKPIFVQESDKNRARYEELSALASLAYQTEKNQDWEKAVMFYQDLKKSARYGYFELVAEAGLYRTSKYVQPAIPADR